MLPAGVASVTSFFLAQALLPRSRMTLAPLVTPLNWLQFAFFIQLIVMPVTVRIWGFAQSEFLRSPPTVLADNVALLLITLAYWSFCAAVHFRNKPSEQKPADSSALQWPLPTFYICFCVALGIVGLAGRFKSFTVFSHYLTDPGVYELEVDRQGASATLFDAAGDLLSTSLGLSMVMVWCRSLDRGLHGSGISKVTGPVLLIVAMLAFAISMGYNRGAFVYPSIALLGVISIRAPRQTARYFLIVTSAMVFLVTSTVIYRTSSHIEDIGSVPSWDVVTQRVDIMEYFQDYGQAPQYLAVMLDESHYGLEPRLGRLSAVSILTQIPKLTKALVPLNGHSYYSALTGHAEENAPFIGEVFLDFNFMGVIVAFWLVGYATAILQQKVLNATDAFEVYVFQIMGVYLFASVLLSVDVLGLFFVFSMFPLYIYFAARPLLRKIGEQKGVTQFQKHA